MERCTSIFVKFGALVLPFYLAGCVTTQGAPSSTGLLPFNLDVSKLTSSLSDALSPQLRELKRLVAESKFEEADNYFVKEYGYFSTRLKGAEAVPEAVSQLGEQVWKTRYSPKMQEVVGSLRAVNKMPPKETWPQLTQNLKKATIFEDAASNDLLLQVTRAGADEQSALREQVQRVIALAKAGRPAALASTFGPLLKSGKHNSGYIGEATFANHDYTSHPEFQEQVLNKFHSVGDRKEFLSEALRLSGYLSTLTTAALDKQFVELVRREFLADGQVSLEEVASLGKVKSPFGGGSDDLAKMVTIGYIDLTSASFKDRNVFDFPLAFKQDLTLNFAPADESVFTSADISRFDYVFVTDLAVAKVARRFKAKKDVKSRAQTGTREVQNPAYITAMTQYQRAMAVFQRAQISSAIPKSCQGWGCVIQGLADGLEQNSARSGVDQASAALAATNQTLSEPVYSQYTYQSVDVDTAKTADVNYYVIDVKKKRLLKNNFQVNDQEVFNVAYNVRDEDPDKSSIMRNTKSEDEVTAWEKRPTTIRLSTLFNEDNLRSATQTPYTDLQEFLRTLSSRTYASAAPTYTQGREPVPSRSTSQTVADERFDSIVIVRNHKASGTGFYVTPDLILTAYHVIEGSSLVELSFYDGTKSYGKVVDHDVRLDLALVRPQTTGKPLKIHSGPIRLGETVEAIGHPKGYEFTITRGVVSAMRKLRSVAIGSANLVEFVQTDTPISPGNSGGPLFLKDAVIGVNDWIRVDKGSQNLNFSVSFNEIREYLDRFTRK